ncbi:hypothetical protein [Pseudomonas putida]|uniref:hypothetical protein n=1 Tax=Pseudomonas putida TaxID=303 RepID=UPI00265B188D|nr:hypothetical protein [Pseudomonas putida]MCZ9638564.1 hypothetical protein [Pseudomonas putida]
MGRNLALALFFVSAACFAGAEKVPATAVDLEGIKAAMDDVLKDSDSSKLKGVFLTREDKAWQFCGLVNAKNSYGAYAGYSPFIGMKFPRDTGKDVYVVMSVGDGAGIVCGNAVK